MNDKKTTVRTGVTGIELLQIVFITLKLLGKIDWSWWWVLAPTWISIAIAIVYLLGALIYCAIDFAKFKKRINK